MNNSYLSACYRVCHNLTLFTGLKYEIMDSKSPSGDGFSLYIGGQFKCFRSSAKGILKYLNRSRVYKSFTKSIL